MHGVKVIFKKPLLSVQLFVVFPAGRNCLEWLERGRHNKVAGYRAGPRQLTHYISDLLHSGVKAYTLLKRLVVSGDVYLKRDIV